FGVFQTSLARENDANWMDIYFDYKMGRNVQETQFFAMPESDVDRNRHFPINTLFDTVAYRRATANFDEETVKLIDEMQAVFKEVQIPVQSIRTDDKGTVAIIFERVN